MSIQECVHSAIAAGFTGGNLVTIVAIAGAESGYNAGATHLNSNGTVDRGMWQINSVHAQFSSDCAFSPPCAALAAKELSGGSNFSPWTVYNTGAYQSHIPEARAEIARQLGQANGQSGGQGTNSDAQFQHLLDCLKSCNTKFPVSKDATDPTNKDKRVQCGIDCHNMRFPDAPIVAPSDIQSACSDCSVQNLNACLKCYGFFFSKGLISVGINLLIGGIILIGVYFLFKPQIDPVVQTAVKKTKEAATVAAIA